MATKGIVKGVVGNLVTIEADGPVAQNEICYITVDGVALMSEVIKVNGKNAYAQVFESTRGMRIGDTVTFEGHMLEVTLGPGDALQELLMGYRMTSTRWRVSSSVVVPTPIP